MDDLAVAKLNLKAVFGANFSGYPSPPLTSSSFHVYDDEYFPDIRPSPREKRIVDHQHDALKIISGGNHLRSIRNPRAILDLGTGKGAWAAEIAEEFATADEVVGVDIEVVEPLHFPPNCRFETADVCRGIRYPENYFSFIHSRSMKTVIHSWPEYIAEIFRVTANGGHIQLTESMKLISTSGTLPNDSAIKVIERALQKHAVIKQHDLEVGPKLVDMVREAGYRGIEEKIFEIPVGNWDSDPELNKAGGYMLDYLLDEMSGSARSGMIEIGIQEDAADLYIERARRELRDPRHRLSIKVYYVTARKGSRSRSSSPRGSVSPKPRRSSPS